MSKVLAFLRYKKQQILKRRLKRYAEYLIHNFEKEERKLIGKKKVMVISKGEYDYTFFNICYLNNMLSLALLAMYRGYLPVFEKSDGEKIGWEWYFTPLEDMWGVDTCKKVYMKERISPYAPSFDMVCNSDCKDFEIWKAFTKHLLQLNPKMEEYLQKDTSNLSGFSGDFQMAMGVLLRGTDYTKMKPAGHPIQPSVEDICKRIQAGLLSNPQYKYIYVATEEKRLCDYIKRQFPQIIVLENKRHYIDDMFYEQTLDYVSEVKLDLENENYSRGIEYLSSLVILSKCNMIISGVSGGSCGAFLLRGDLKNCEILYSGKY